MSQSKDSGDCSFDVLYIVGGCEKVRKTEGSHGTLKRSSMGQGEAGEGMPAAKVKQAGNIYRVM